MRFILSCVLGFGLTSAAFAQCQGADLRDTLTPEEQSELAQMVAETPYPQGNHWRATRGDMVINLIGTVHLDDPRLDAPEARLAPVIQSASQLLLEITPEDEAALQDNLMADPGMLLLDDTTLPDLMSEDAWQALAKAVQARGVPPFMAAKFQPWYLSMLLAVPPCATETLATGKGLDKRLAAIATAADVPMTSLEPYDSIFRMFADAPMDEQIAMIEASLIDPDVVEDMFATVLATFIEQETVQGWEVSRILTKRLTDMDSAEVDAAYADMAANLLDTRNRNWIPVILDAAQSGPIVVASGAAHLAGDAGLLNLLAMEGFTLERQPF